MLRNKLARPFLALLLALAIACGAFLASFAEDEETATTSTTVTSEEKTEKDSKEEPKSEDEEKSSSTTKKDSDKDDDKDDKSTTKQSEDESTTSKEDESTTEPTTEEPTTEAPKEPDFAPDYTGIAQTTYEGVEGWWRVVNGKINFKAQSIYQNRYGWWKTKDGKVDFSYTGVAQNQYGWWRVKTGKVDFNAHGAFRNQYGTWYVKNGKVDFGKTGTVVVGKTSYTVREGKVSGATIKVPLVNQLPNYPTGCEAASATMVLKYWGYDINLSKMVNTIPRENLRTIDGRKYGPRITEKFVGDPRSTYTSKNPGYGAFAPVVSKAMNNVISNQHGKHKAYNKTGTSFTDLLDYLNEGKPVIVWSTYNLKTPSTVNAWYIATSTGPEYFSYPRGTHVCVLVGYDGKNIYLADPYGAKTKTFSRSAFNDKYKLLGRQAVVVQ